jgi:hypothetical protein
VVCILCSAPKPGASSFAQRALTPDDAAAEGVALPQPAVPAKAKARKSSREVDEKSVPQDRSGLW